MSDLTDLQKWGSCTGGNMSDELREQIAREVGQHALNCPWEDINDPDQDAAYRSTDFILKLIKDAGYLQVEPVQLEVLGDEEISTIWHEYNENQSWHGQLRRIRKVSQATIAHNEAKGQLFRRK